jgi:molybdate/tungstate transport system ATP-binding protein
VIEASVRRKLGGFYLSADFTDGGFVCLTGKNGSGKTCFLKAIAGQLPIDQGYVKVGGRDITRLPVEKRGVVLVTPGSSIPHLGVDAHLRWGAGLRKIPVDEGRLSQVKADLGIDFGGRVRVLSLGMRERVSLATALLASPRAILVDEAFSNIHDRQVFIAAYRRLASAAGIDVIFSTQEESDASLADHLYVITDGKIERRV